MEDALAPRVSFRVAKNYKVLILVVMEDALAHGQQAPKNVTIGLNPCCNGRCTRTS